MLYLVLSFILGFLVATGLALGILPMLWRRASTQTRRHIEASMPLSREELRAEIDAVKAGHAMAMRRLEMKAEAIKRKAAEDFVEINSLREQVKQFQEDGAERDEMLSRLEQERQEYASALADRDAELERVSGLLAEAERKLKDKEAELQDLSETYEEASLTSSSRQVELLARETEMEGLKDAIKRLQAERKDVERTMYEALAAKTQIDTELRAERKRSEELERKLERMAGSISSRDEKLERHRKEIARLKQKVRDNAKAGQGDGPAEKQEQTSVLETQIRDIKQQLSTPQAEGANASTTRKPEVERLRSRLTAIMRENKKLRAELAGGNGSANGSTDEVLREQIAELAAEVVNMAAALEGPDSPIEKALTQAATGNGEEKGAPSSLAERVQALRQKSASAE